MDANKIIDLLGGTAEVARLCEVRPPSVSEWRRSGIPHARLMYLRAVRPEVFAPAKARAPEEAACDEVEMVRSVHAIGAPNEQDRRNTDGSAA